MELQQFFVKIRDELCKNGEILLSPALSYTAKHLHSDVEQERREKLPHEIEEDQLKGEEEKKSKCIFPFITNFVQPGSEIFQLDSLNGSIYSMFVMLNDPFDFKEALLVNL